jgi:hypothetical protein
VVLMSTHLLSVSIHNPTLSHRKCLNMQHPWRTLLYDLFVAQFARLLRPFFGRKPNPARPDKTLPKKEF